MKAVYNIKLVVTDRDIQCSLSADELQDIDVRLQMSLLKVVAGTTRRMNNVFARWNNEDDSTLIEDDDTESL